MNQTIECENCKSVLKSTECVCNKCGSNKKNVFIQLEDEIKIREQLKGKVKDHTKTGKRRESLKFTDGEEQSVNGDWIHKLQIVDYPNDLYIEKITTENGVITRDVNESLRNHRDRGSAKFKNKIE